MRLLATAALLLLMAVPVASAAGAQATLAFAPLEPLAPGVAQTVQGNLTYTYDHAAANATTVTLTVQQSPAWLAARFDPVVLQVDAADPSGRTVVPVTLSLTVAPGTAALEQGALALAADAASNGDLAAVNTSADVPVKVAFAGPVRIEAALDPVPARPGEPATVPLRVTNGANGPARITLEASGIAKDVRLLPPSPFIVEVGERLINVSALAPDGGRFPVSLHFTSTHAFDARMAGPSGDVAINMAVAQAGVPGFEVTLLVTALALAARRR